MADGIYILKGGEKLDEHGQPRNRTYNSRRLADRSTDELVGLCKALVADGKLSDEEVSFLASWVGANRHFCTTWPANIICARIDRILEDQIVDAEEREDLFDLLSSCVAGRDGHIAENYSTALPLTTPAPPLFFANHAYCFTGKMSYGPRKACQSLILGRGGKVQDHITLDLHYLVIGRIGSTDWMHTTHGRKIEQAVEFQRKGAPIVIVSEEHWTDHIL